MVRTRRRETWANLGTRVAEPHGPAASAPLAQAHQPGNMGVLQQAYGPPGGMPPAPHGGGKGWDRGRRCCVNASGRYLAPRTLVLMGCPFAPSQALPLRT